MYIYVCTYTHTYIHICIIRICTYNHLHRYMQVFVIFEYV